MIQNFIYIFMLFIITSCATGSVIVTGEQREAIDPSYVTIYSAAPDKPYEHIGIVRAESEEIFSQQEAVDRALQELKIQAASIGANGIIFSNIGEKQKAFTNYTPSATGGGFFYSGKSNYQTLQGNAIYVKN